jgi:hypothetical protein
MTWVVLEHCTSGMKYLDAFCCAVLFGVSVVGVCYHSAVYDNGLMMAVLSRK